MSTSEQERASELARLWQVTVVPMDAEAQEQARRERVVPRISEAIERAAQRQRRRRYTQRLAAALSAAAIVLGVGFAHFARAPQRVTPTVTAGTEVGGVRATQGAVTLLRNAHPEVVTNTALEVNDSFTTAAGSRAELRLTDLVVAEVGAASEVAVVAPRMSVHRLLLTHGRIDAHVDDRPSRTPKLVVETPDAEVVVTGTVFQVDVTRPDARGTGATTVSVTKGRIVVRRRGIEVATVTAGQSWTSSVTQPVAVPESIPELPAPSPAVPAREHGAPSPSPVAAVIRPRVAPSAETVAIAGTLAEENALFQSAVEARKQGNDYLAIARLTELLSRYPASPLVSESRIERMRALQRTGHVMEASREAKRYLSESPNGFARDEAERLVRATEGL